MKSYIGNESYKDCKDIKKVLILTPFFPPKIGGAESFALRLEVELSKNYDVDVCTLEWHKDHTWEGCNKWEGIKVIMRLMFKAFPMCWGKEYDKIYALGLNAGFVSIILKKIFKIKPTITLLALYNFGKRIRITRWLFGHMDKIFTEGEIGKRNAIKMGAKKNKIIVYNHWVDTTKYFPIERKGKFTILFVSRPIHIKGMHIIKAVEKLDDGKKLNAKFVYANNVPLEDMPKLFQQADVLVVPSLYEEGFPLTIAEGANCGCVVVSSNCGSLPEMVDPFGFTIEPTVLNFRALLHALSKDKRRMKHLRRLTIQYAKDNFSSENVEVFI